jgi:uncharacterized protein
MSRSEPTYIGEVQSVSGATVSVQLKDDMTSSLRLIGGQSYRIGQIGAFLRIPLGYTNLYGICTLVGAAALPEKLASDIEKGKRWLTIVLFGESLGGQFERGVSQYPTVGDEVHVVTSTDLEVIYGQSRSSASINVGAIAASSGISAHLDLAKLVGRHSAILGSTGSGKSNLVAVVLEAIATQGFPSARVLIIDPHGEYASALAPQSEVFKIRPEKTGEKPLYVPFWALPFNEFKEIALGELTAQSEQAVRDEVTNHKRAAVAHLPGSANYIVTADAPIPFSAKQLWFVLDDFERRTLDDRDSGKLSALTTTGDPDKLTSNIYPSPNPGGKAPFRGNPRNLARQLELFRSRLQDSRFSFLFAPGPDHTPSLDGKISNDLDSLVGSWVGHSKPITVLDVSGLPSEVMAAIVGTLLRIVYDMLFWASDLEVSGKRQPLLIALEEAHLFLPEGSSSTAHRTVTKIAKEGRKYGVGLCVITQRPTEVDGTVLSQCGTMIALRLTNSADRSRVVATMPDDLGGIASMLPSLRTGEGLVIGEAIPIPSRIMFNRARAKLDGGDPILAKEWKKDPRPNAGRYEEALRRWREQSMSQPKP